MSGKTKIEWATDVWNPVRGCTKVSSGCTNCYACRMAARFSKACGFPHNGNIPEPFHGFAEMSPLGPRWTGRVELIESQLKIPLRWRKPRRIFVNSMSDSFHEALPDDTIRLIFSVMERCRQHTFLVLTKRAERMRNLLGRSDWWAGTIKGFRSHVWLGVSVEDRASLHRIDSLRETPAALRFLSLEPLLEDLGELDLRGISLCIVGGESGPGARPMNPAWARSVRKQCFGSGVNFFMKQMGSFWAREQNRDPDRWEQVDSKGSDPSDWEPDLRVRETPGVSLG